MQVLVRQSKIFIEQIFDRTRGNTGVTYSGNYDVGRGPLTVGPSDSPQEIPNWCAQTATFAAGVADGSIVVVGG